MARTIFDATLDLSNGPVFTVTVPSDSSVLTLAQKYWRVSRTNTPVVSFIVDANDKPLRDDVWEIQLYLAHKPIVEKAGQFIGTFQQYDEIYYAFATKMPAGHPIAG